MARPQLVEPVVEGGERAEGGAARRPRPRRRYAIERVANGAERARERRPADVPLEHVPAPDRLHPGRELVYVEPAQLPHEAGVGGGVREAPHDGHAEVLERVVELLRERNEHPLPLVVGMGHGVARHGEHALRAVGAETGRDRRVLTHDPA